MVDQTLEFASLLRVTCDRVDNSCIAHHTSPICQYYASKSKKKEGREHANNANLLDSDFWGNGGGGDHWLGGVGLWRRHSDAACCCSKVMISGSSFGSMR